MGHGGHHRILSRRLIEVSQILQRQQEPCTGCDPLEAKVRGLWHGGGGMHGLLTVARRGASGMDWHLRHQALDPNPNPNSLPYIQT